MSNLMISIVNIGEGLLHDRVELKLLFILSIEHFQ